MSDLLPDPNPEITVTPAEPLPLQLPYGIRLKSRRRFLRVAGFTIAGLLVLGGAGVVLAQSMGVSPMSILGLAPAHPPGRSMAMDRGGLVETTNDSGTIQINAAAATDSSNSDRLDDCTGMSAQETSTSVLALDLDKQS